MSMYCPCAFLTGAPGMGELLLLFVVILVLFGPKRLPGIARMIGKTLDELRRASQDFKDQIMQIDERGGSARTYDVAEGDFRTGEDEYASASDQPSSTDGNRDYPESAVDERERKQPPEGDRPVDLPADNLQAREDGERNVSTDERLQSVEPDPGKARTPGAGDQTPDGEAAGPTLAG
jgi:TatA/E family protein of Tat protein translocase